MIEYLEQLKKARTTGLAFPALVQDNDLTSIFRMLDPVGQGYITYSQYASSMPLIRFFSFFNESFFSSHGSTWNHEIQSQSKWKRE